MSDHSNAKALHYKQNPPMSPFKKGGIKGGFEKAMLKLP